MGVDAVKRSAILVPVKRAAAVEQHGYHHGDLPNVLRASAVDVIASKGLHSFSLREVARRAGVSHAAPGYHFGDARGLLTSVAIEGFRTLHDELVRSADGIDDPVERLKAIGRGYVRVATEHPAHCEVMFRDDAVDSNDPELAAAGFAAYAVLEDAVAAIAERHDPSLSVRVAARLCWSAMQGLVALHAKFEFLDAAAGVPAATLDEHVDRFTELMVDGMVPQMQRTAARTRPARRG